MTRRFTGFHMLFVMVAFFGVVIAVNLVMATNAIRSFGGVVVQNSYVASQQFNGWIAQGREQQKLGWQAQAAPAPDGALAVTLTGPTGPLDGALVAVSAEHPLGRLPGQTLVLTGVGQGRYLARHTLPPGRWKLNIQAQRDGHDARFVQDIRL